MENTNDLNTHNAESPEPTFDKGTDEQLVIKSTLETLESMFHSKVKKWLAIRSLARTEAELSFSAFLLCIGMLVAIVMLGFSVWGLTNLILIQLLSMFFPTVISYIVAQAINVALLFFLLHQVKRVKKDISMRRTISAVKGTNK